MSSKPPDFISHNSLVSHCFYWNRFVKFGTLMWQLNLLKTFKN